jgi:hypothetical protein
LWPKGDGWGGGGQFKSRKNLLLNHRDAEMHLAPGFRIPDWLGVAPFGTHSGWGEDDPVWSDRLIRDGWKITSPGRHIENSFDAKVWITFDPPRVFEKPHPVLGNRYLLRLVINGLKEKNGPWSLVEHSVVDGQGSEHRGLGRSDWADWLPDGDLAFATSGKLYRVSSEPRGFESPARLIVDLSDRAFRERKAPEHTMTW